MSAEQELQHRLRGTNTLIARYQEALASPTTTSSESAVLRVNLRTLKNVAARLETEARKIAGDGGA